MVCSIQADPSGRKHLRDSRYNIIKKVLKLLDKSAVNETINTTVYLYQRISKNIKYHHITTWRLTFGENFKVLASTQLNS